MAKERAITFGPVDVRALLDGSKTQTRRPIKPQPPSVEAVRSRCGSDFSIFTDRHWPDGFRVAGSVGVVRELMDDHPAQWVSPYGMPGDLLWVRETWGLCSYTDDTDWYRGKVGDRNGTLTTWQLQYGADWLANQDACFWRPSIHQPRWASRITLEVTGVRVERVQEITEADAVAEGVTTIEDLYAEAERDASTEVATTTAARLAFARLWQSTYGADSWERNDWVWVVSCQRVKGGE